MKVKRAYKVDVNGSITPLKDVEGKELSFKEMYPIIGCGTIEHVGLGKGIDMWIDEEGLLGPWVGNMKATQMYRDAYPHIDPKELFIVGTAIITDNTAKGGYIEKYGN